MSTCSKDRVEEEDMALTDIIRKFFVYELFMQEKSERKITFHKILLSF